MRRSDPLPALSLAFLLLLLAAFHALRGGPAPAPGPPPAWRIDLNRAPVRHLVLLPGIGPVRAAAIEEERRRAAFGSLEDLERIHGIGPATVALLREWAAVR